MKKMKRDVQRDLKEYEAEEIFHRREWVMQRIGWAILALLLLAACAGLLGNGPLARRHIAMAVGILSVDRFVRRDANTEWKFAPRLAASPTDKLEVRISSRFLERFRLAGITPEPRSQTAHADCVVFSFAALTPRVQIVFHVEPLRVGISEGKFQIGGSQPIVVKQFVYP
jgi:hypothetical protein